MSNLTILERNIIHGFGAYRDVEGVETVFLKARDRQHLIDAERKANGWGAVSDKFVVFLRFALEIHGLDHDHGVLEFVRKRYQNMGDA